MKNYTIRDGFTFVMPDGQVLTGGEQVNLPDDIAQQHLHKLEGIPAPDENPDGEIDPE